MLAREDFAGLVRSSVAGMGFHRDIAMVIFPVDQFLVEQAPQAALPTMTASNPSPAIRCHPGSRLNEG